MESRMTDRSGDRDYVIHGSLDFSLSVSERCETPKATLYLFIYIALTLICSLFRCLNKAVCLCCKGFISDSACWGKIFLAGFQWELPQSLCYISRRLTVLISASPACFLLIKLASLLSPAAGWQTGRQTRSQAGGQQ